VKTPRPVHGLRAGALLVSGIVNAAGAAAVLFAMPAADDARVAAAWAVVQFISGAWAGVLGAHSPFLHGMIAGIPALALGLLVHSVLPPQFVLVSWLLAPAAALVAAAIMRFMRHRS
jgi:hypothetical protein